MKGLTLDREAQIKASSYENAMKLLWMWIKQGVIDSPNEFIKAVHVIESIKQKSY